MFSRKQNLVEYNGNIIVCLDKARPYSSLKDNGRTIIGRDLTKVKIKLKNGKVLKVPSENDKAVPVFICNWHEDEPLVPSMDWTVSASPITEIKYAPLPKWWPKAMFSGVQRIGENEEVILEYDKFVIKLRVWYAFTHEEKELFKNIPPSINEALPTPLSQPLMRQKKFTDAELQSFKDFRNEAEAAKLYLLPGEEKNNSESRCVQKIQTKPSTSNFNLKLVVGSVVFVLLSIGIYFGFKTFINKGDE